MLSPNRVVVFTGKVSVGKSMLILRLFELTRRGSTVPKRTSMDHARHSCEVSRQSRRLTHTLASVAQMRRAYLDCEFTSLDEFFELISLALVVHDGPEFYVEIDDSWVRNECSNFVQATVLPLLALEQFGRPMAVARNELHFWLRQFDTLEIISDAPQWDWPLLLRLAGPSGLPEGVSARAISYADKALMESIVFPHHALQDARLIAGFMESLRNGAGNIS